MYLSCEEMRICESQLATRLTVKNYYRADFQEDLHWIWGDYDEEAPYGVATISRLLTIVGLFCKRTL